MSSSVDQSLESAAGAILGLARGTREPARLVAMSGIDGSGKTLLSERLAALLTEQGLRVARIGVDPWQNPQAIRFGGDDRGVHFYQHAIRFDALFTRVVDPLVRHRSLDLVTRGIRTDRDIYDELVYRHDDVDVVLLEGIFLLQERFNARYDLRVWVDCSFDTALRRALARNAEGLPADRLREDYATIYHAAQRHHFEVDDPWARADRVIANDPDHRDLS